MDLAADTDWDEIASDPTAWRLSSQLDEVMLASLRVARAEAHQIAWASAPRNQ